MIKALLIIAALSILSFAINASAQEYEPTIINGYYYMDEIEIYGIIIEEKPTICAFEIEDLNMPEGTNEQLIEIASKSTHSWQKALGWDLNLRVVSLSEQWNVDLLDEECEVIIYFIPQEDELIWEDSGFANFENYAVTDNFGPVSDLYIIYRDVAYDEVNEPYYYINEIAFDLEATITHELGHAFSLDHPDSIWENFVEQDGVMYADSIMGDPGIIPITYLGDVVYEITQQDIEAMILLYGENGFEPDGELGFSKYLFEEPSEMQKTLKYNIARFPEHFPANYIAHLDSLGLII